MVSVGHTQINAGNRLRVIPQGTSSSLVIEGPCPAMYFETVDWATSEAKLQQFAMAP